MREDQQADASPRCRVISNILSAQSDIRGPTDFNKARVSRDIPRSSDVVKRQAEWGERKASATRRRSPDSRRRWSVETPRGGADLPQAGDVAGAGVDVLGGELRVHHLDRLTGVVEAEGVHALVHPHRAPADLVEAALQGRPVVEDHAAAVDLVEDVSALDRATGPAAVADGVARERGQLGLVGPADGDVRGARGEGRVVEVAEVAPRGPADVAEPQARDAGEPGERPLHVRQRGVLLPRGVVGPADGAARVPARAAVVHLPAEAVRRGARADVPGRQELGRVEVGGGCRGRRDDPDLQRPRRATTQSVEPLRLDPEHPHLGLAAGGDLELVGTDAVRLLARDHLPLAVLALGQRQRTLRVPGRDGPDDPDLLADLDGADARARDHREALPHPDRVGVGHHSGLVRRRRRRGRRVTRGTGRRPGEERRGHDAGDEVAEGTQEGCGHVESSLPGGKAVGQGAVGQGARQSMTPGAAPSSSTQSSPTSKSSFFRPFSSSLPRPDRPPAPVPAPERPPAPARAPDPEPARPPEPERPAPAPDPERPAPPAPPTPARPAVPPDPAAAPERPMVPAPPVRAELPMPRTALAAVPRPVVPAVPAVPPEVGKSPPLSAPVSLAPSSPAAMPPAVAPAVPMLLPPGPPRPPVEPGTAPSTGAVGSPVDPVPGR